MYLDLFLVGPLTEKGHPETVESKKLLCLLGELFKSPSVWGFQGQGPGQLHKERLLKGQQVGPQRTPEVPGSVSSLLPLKE